VVLGGCGHVGLPLGLAFARAGRTVVAYDVDRDAVQSVGEGRMPFRDRGADALLRAVLDAGRFRCTGDPAVLSEASEIVCVVGTPVDEYLNPKLYLMSDLLQEHMGRFRPGQLFVLRSTLYPGTTERCAAMFRERGLEVDVAFCPERVAEGVALEEITALPQIVAGCSPRAQARAEALFRPLTPDLIPLPPLAAELAKLFNNAWRYCQFALANQFYMMANDHGVDFYQVHEAMTLRYPRAAGFPKAGLTAGPCLFKDTVQLGAFHHHNFFLGQAAIMINEGLPAYLVRGAARHFDLKSLRVGILGMTFKAESDDPRDSLAFKLKKILQVEAKEVLVTDPFLAQPDVLPLETVLGRCGLLFIGAPHAAYRGLDFRGLPVIDPWGLTEQRVRVL
jgi:UDP-N-acetyl-D-mannosaminuronic acid dehydrogenase